MDEFTVTRLALILSIQAEIEGMKAENTQRKQLGYSITYGELDFCKKAEELRKLAIIHNK